MDSRAAASERRLVFQPASLEAGGEVAAADAHGSRGCRRDVAVCVQACGDDRNLPHALKSTPQPRLRSEGVRRPKLAIDLRDPIEADPDLLVDEDAEPPLLEEGAELLRELLVRWDVPVAEEDLAHS